MKMRDMHYFNRNDGFLYVCYIAVVLIVASGCLFGCDAGLLTNRALTQSMQAKVGDGMVLKVLGTHNADIVYARGVEGGEGFTIDAETGMPVGRFSEFYWSESKGTDAKETALGIQESQADAFRNFLTLAGNWPRCLCRVHPLLFRVRLTAEIRNELYRNSFRMVLR